jgi:beta-glucosidase
MLFFKVVLLLTFGSLAQALVSQPDFAGEGRRIQDLQAAQPSIAARDSVPAGFTAAPYYPTPPGGWISSKHY